MRVGIIQSNYIPWRGYFDFINSAEVFVFYDNVQYTKRDWRNRNRIKTENGVKWLTVPVQYKYAAQHIDDTRIDYNQKWQVKHLRAMEHAYGKMPYFTQYFPRYREILEEGHLTISTLNQALIRWLMSCLDINTPLRTASEFKLTGRRTERLIELLTQLGATTYLSGPSAASYLEYDLFRKANIALEFKSYDYPPYPQPHGSFVPSVTVLDLLFSMGGEAKKYLKSAAPDRSFVIKPESGDP
ncbi:MAG: WbqC family protein [Desulfovibrio sp.]|jgi:hypothetical protein|nr:WbqC family protein [Desulfovibrio sp.]